MPEFAIQFQIWVNTFHGEVYIAKMTFKELLVFLVRNISSYLFAKIVQQPFANVESSHNFLFEGFELF